MPDRTGPAAARLRPPACPRLRPRRRTGCRGADRRDAAERVPFEKTRFGRVDPGGAGGDFGRDAVEPFRQDFRHRQRDVPFAADAARNPGERLRIRPARFGHAPREAVVGIDRGRKAAEQELEFEQVAFLLRQSESLLRMVAQQGFALNEAGPVVGGENFFAQSLKCSGVHLVTAPRIGSVE